jgi:hypothetical protein
MATRVFISYRRDDSAGSAGRVHDRLQRDLGRDLLFMDVDAIPLGVNFVKVLRDEVAKCDVLLAVIGPHWIDARDEDGNRRLDDPNDFLRVEIATALQRNIPVIPILVDGAKVPKSDRLPKDLEELEQRNGLEIRHASFHSDVDKLIGGLKGLSDRVDDPRTAGKPLPPNVTPAPAPEPDPPARPGKTLLQDAEEQVAALAAKAPEAVSETPSGGARADIGSTREEKVGSQKQSEGKGVRAGKGPAAIGLGFFSLSALCFLLARVGDFSNYKPLNFLFIPLGIVFLACALGSWIAAASGSQWR